MVIFLSIVLKQFKEVAERASPCQCARIFFLGLDGCARKMLKD
jgi:hypothetical protein